MQIAPGGESHRLAPQRETASGGELSRVMLAAKTVLAGADRVPTLVFDEIDAGVGGRLGSATANGTEIRSLGFTLHAGTGTVTTDHLSAEIAGIGTITGSGNIGPGAALDYRLRLKLNELVPNSGGAAGLANDLAGALSPTWARRLQGAIRYLSQGPMKNGVPLLIRGTARKPTVTPDIGALLPAERRR